MNESNQNENGYDHICDLQKITWFIILVYKISMKMNSTKIIQNHLFGPWKWNENQMKTNENHKIIIKMMIKPPKFNHYYAKFIEKQAFLMNHMMFSWCVSKIEEPMRVILRAQFCIRAVDLTLKV